MPVTCTTEEVDFQHLSEVFSWLSRNLRKQLRWQICIKLMHWQKILNAFEGLYIPFFCKFMRCNEATRIGEPQILHSLHTCEIIKATYGEVKNDVYSKLKNLSVICSRPSFH